MKKYSGLIQSNRGFILPGLLLFTSLVLIVFTHSLHLYKTNQLLTVNEIEQIKMETLFQMGHQSFIQDLSKESVSLPLQPVIYTFPYGVVTVTYTSPSNNTLDTHFSIETNQNSRKQINRLVQKPN